MSAFLEGAEVHCSCNPVYPGSLAITVAIAVIPIQLSVVQSR
ncbi:MAG: hypothetical protein WCI77_01620 [Candidatus Omnitrophota bacterium]